MKTLHPLTLAGALAFTLIGCADDGAYDSAGASWGGGDAPGSFAEDAPVEGEIEGEGEVERPLPQPGQLTAGEWRDLDEWDFWLSLFAQDRTDRLGEHLRTWGIQPLERVAAVVTYDGAPAIDVEVVLEDERGVAWTARTDNRGRAELWPALFGEGHSDPQAERPGVVLRVGEAVVAEALPADGAPIEIDLAAHGFAPPADPEGLDLMLVVDTTGSMCDELRYLQSELAGVVRAVRRTHGDDLPLRVAIQVYRDRGDDYVVRQFPFESDPDRALADLLDQGCGGGGDYPEAVGPALAAATDLEMQGGGWRAGARARLMFLVLDAPAHDDSQTLAQLHAGVADAAAAGVRIVPVASSGVDRATEFMLRSFAVVTGGTYVFLTDDSGIGDSHLEPTVGPYRVEPLDNLMTRLINSALE